MGATELDQGHHKVHPGTDAYSCNRDTLDMDYNCLNRRQSVNPCFPMGVGVRPWPHQNCVHVHDCFCISQNGLQSANSHSGCGHNNRIKNVQNQSRCENTDANTPSVTGASAHLVLAFVSKGLMLHCSVCRHPAFA